MGHQVNFYMRPQDTASVEEALGALGSFIVLHSRSTTSAPRLVKSLNFDENGQPWLYLYVARFDDLHSIVTRPVPAQGYWTVDVMKSPVVEFTRSFFDETILRRGRVYYVDGFYGADGEWSEKPEAFRRWAKSVLGVTRKLLRRRGSEYIGLSAEAWLTQESGKLEK